MREENVQSHVWRNLTIMAIHEVLMTVSRVSQALPKVKSPLLAAQRVLMSRMCAHLMKRCPEPTQDDLYELIVGDEFTGDIFQPGQLDKVNQTLLPYIVMKQLMHEEQAEIHPEARSWRHFDRVFGKVGLNKP